MDARVTNARGETERHSRLKRLAFLWAQAQGYSACAMEVSFASNAGIVPTLPPIDRSLRTIGSTAIFECKQALCDLRRDNCQSDVARKRLETICERRQLLETRLREHYPNLRNGDSLFPEFDLPDFTVIGHRGYSRVLRELRALQNRLYDCTKFDKLIRYRCANLSFLVLPRSFSATQKSRSDGARLWNPTARSSSCANQSGRKQPSKIEFAYYSESPWLGRERSIDNWKSRSRMYCAHAPLCISRMSAFDSRPDSSSGPPLKARPRSSQRPELDRQRCQCEHCCSNTRSLFDGYSD